MNSIRIAIVRKMIRQGHGKERTERFLHFLWNILHTSDPEANRKYLNEIGKLTEGGTIDMNTLELARQYGIEDSIALGMEMFRKKAKEEKRSIALKLKKMGLSTKDIFQVVGLSIQEIESL